MSDCHTGDTLGIDTRAWWCEETEWVEKQMASFARRGEAAETVSCICRGRVLPVVQTVLRGLCLVCHGEQTVMTSLFSSLILILQSVKTDSGGAETGTGRVDATSTTPALP